jgi:hypothetical protein
MVLYFSISDLLTDEELVQMTLKVSFPFDPKELLAHWAAGNLLDPCDRIELQAASVIASEATSSASSYYDYFLVLDGSFHSFSSSLVYVIKLKIASFTSLTGVSSSIQLAVVSAPNSNAQAFFSIKAFYQLNTLSSTESLLQFTM